MCMKSNYQMDQRLTFQNSFWTVKFASFVLVLLTVTIKFVQPTNLRSKWEGKNCYILPSADSQSKNIIRLSCP